MSLISIIAERNRGGGGGFDPLSLSPAWWFDASDALTLYDATSGGSLVAPTGAVARMNDKSGNARHAIQSQIIARPTRQTAIQNGLDCLLFDGTNSKLVPTGFAFTTGTIFAVIKRLSVQSGYRGVVNIQNAGGGTGMYARLTGGNWGVYSSIDRPASSAISTTNFSIMAMSDNGGSGGNFYLNGVSDGTWMGDSGNFDTNLGGGTGQLTHCYLGEVLVYPLLGSTDRNAVYSYLSAKWGI